ncbi:hypothetical protein SBOR_1451 [Sclerotinia borealis F-4128]|uniref:UBA domain-containing protein n=1 Tax=Sclerotinia borealis (strain F-4128) TaxID=1432307 RepID=W9CQ12_SCLBF|nr:hypothetical protein SBOR_1451 [Sclerotinia borealis F-4128]
MSGNTSPGASHLPMYHYFNTIMTPYEIDMDSFQWEVKPVLANATDIIQRSPAPRQKFVRFAPKAVDIKYNEFKTKSNNGRQRNNAAALTVANDSKMMRIPSPSELSRAGSPRQDPSSTQIQSSHRRTIRENPTERSSRMEFEAQNYTSSQNGQFKLVVANTPTQFPPRVPSPPASRDPPPTPRPARLSTPDFTDDYDDCPRFCDCCGNYEAERSGRTLDSRKEGSACSKMEYQYQAASAYIGDRRLVAEKRKQDLAVVPTEDTQVWNLMRMGYPRSVAITTLEAYRHDFEKAATFLEYNY